jgi:hypothetical protein
MSIRLGSVDGVSPVSFHRPDGMRRSQRYRLDLNRDGAEDLYITIQVTPPHGSPSYFGMGLVFEGTAATVTQYGSDPRFGVLVADFNGDAFLTFSIRLGRAAAPARSFTLGVPRSRRL